jgi:ketosteroid isomerase-like protein
MPSQHESPALRVARAHVDAWSRKDWATARSLLSPDVHVTATHNGPYPPPTDLTGADDYMKGLVAFAEPIVAGSVRELAGAGDDRNALITLDLQAAFDPSGPAVAAPCARLYLVENGKIKTEQVVFYVSQG